MGEFEARDASVVAIGQGTGEQAAHYAEKWGIGFPILGDPKAAAYQAFGMLRGSWWTVLGRSMLTDPLETMRLMFEADMRGAALPAADVLRLPGIAVVERGGTLRFLYKSQEPSDLPPNADVLAALDSLSR
jgi:hypothetical protein